MKYEKVLVSLNFELKDTLDKIQIVDKNGWFEESDEVGFVFEYIKKSIQQIEELFN